MDKCLNVDRALQKDERLSSGGPDVPFLEPTMVGTWKQ